MTTNVLALALTGSFSPGAAIVSGLIGAVSMLAIIYAGRAAGMTSMDLLRTLGTMVAPASRGSTVWLIGLGLHLMMGAVFGLVHVGLLHGFDPSSSASAAWLGLVLGAIHGMVVVMVMPVLLTMAHPLVRTRDVPDPGLVMNGFGRLTPVGMVMAHAAFGIVVGAVYVAVI